METSFKVSVVSDGALRITRYQGESYESIRPAAARLAATMLTDAKLVQGVALSPRTASGHAGDVANLYIPDYGIAKVDVPEAWDLDTVWRFKRNGRQFSPVYGWDASKNESGKPWESVIAQAHAALVIARGRTVSAIFQDFVDLDNPLEKAPNAAARLAGVRLAFSLLDIAVPTGQLNPVDIEAVVYKALEIKEPKYRPFDKAKELFFSDAWVDPSASYWASKKAEKAGYYQVARKTAGEMGGDSEKIEAAAAASVLVAGTLYRSATRFYEAGSGSALDEALFSALVAAGQAVPVSKK